MRTALFTLAALLGLALPLGAQPRTDTLKVSDLFTTHIIFNTDLIYADLSNSQVMAAKIIDQSKNMMALKARSPFETPLSVSALESNGAMHTFIIVFDEHPIKLVYDIREEATHQEGLDSSDGKPQGDGNGKGRAVKEKKSRKTAGLYRKGDAPLLKDVVGADRQLWHISARQYDIEVACTNILSYSDITYMVFSLKNGSGVSYECPDATFVVESKKKSRKSVVYDRNIFPKSRSGSISCAPGKTASIGYSMDKISLAKDQVLRVYFYEQGGQRELVLSISADDVNRARNTVK